MCYNKVMDNEIITSQQDVEVYTNEPKAEGITKRVIADAIRVYSQKKLSASSDGYKEGTYVDYLATMIWDGIVEGEIVFADGSTVKVAEDFRDWLDLVKFVCGHLDGGVTQSNTFNGVNIFKVYRGVDPDRV
jgi:hypothetical protein